MLSTITIYNNEHNEGVQLLQEMLRSSWGQSKILDLTFSDYLAALRHPQVNKQYKLRGVGVGVGVGEYAFNFKVLVGFAGRCWVSWKKLFDC